MAVLRAKKAESRSLTAEVTKLHHRELELSDRLIALRSEIEEEERESARSLVDGAASDIAEVSGLRAELRRTEMAIDVARDKRCTAILRVYAEQARVLRQQASQLRDNAKKR